jgi:RNA-directed DNA polymerase
MPIVVMIQGRAKTLGVKGHYIKHDSEERSIFRLDNNLQMNQASKDREKVRDFQRKIYLKAKQDKKFRFYVLYDKVRDERFLREAYKRVKANKGSPGVDGASFEHIEAKGLEQFLGDIHKELQEGTYRPMPVLRTYIKKANGKMRPLGIPTIKDRVVQMSCKLVIEPIFEADFEKTSYGFRPKRSTKDAIEEIKNNLTEERTEIFDADLSQYFDTIPHDRLMKVIAGRISDKKVLTLIKKWLKCPVSENGKISGGKKNKKGTPQGGVISPLLANVYLHLLDSIINKVNGRYQRIGAKIVRYADDFVIMGKRLTGVVIEDIKRIISRLGLTLNEEKTRVVKAKEESFNFLGFTIRHSRSRYKDGKKYWAIIPSKKAEKGIREKLSEYMRNHISIGSEKLVQGLNEKIRGWTNYYRIPKVSNTSDSFTSLSYYIATKLERCMKKKSQRRCKLGNQKAFRVLVDKFGLIDPAKLHV